ncbi:MAG: GntR family transcriptional regulator [Balneolales bacterium]
MKEYKQPVPKYYQIYNELLEQIRSGKFRESDLFPSDTSLVQKYGVSRGTIREAVKLLFQQGYLIREQGKGTFVTYQKIDQEPDKLMGFTELMRNNDMVPSAHLIEKKIVVAPPNLINLMHLSVGDKLVRIIRVRLGDEQPLIVERSYFTYDLFKPIYKEDLQANSIYELLYKHTEIRLGDAEQRIEAISAGKSEARLLNVNPGAPLLLIKRLVKTEKGGYFQYSEDVYRSDRINFSTTTRPYERHHDNHGFPLELKDHGW